MHRLLVPLAPVVRGLQELLGVEAERRHVHFELDVPERLPSLAADADQLQQVLLNLTLNACDACSAGGHVRLSATACMAGDARAVEKHLLRMGPENMRKVQAKLTELAAAPGLPSREQARGP